jgi:hypothetical protein
MSHVRMSEAAPRWPLWSMLLFGHFGEDATPDSLRADRRARIAIAAFVIVAAVVYVAPGLGSIPRQHVVTALVGPQLAYLAWERWRYAAGLDELARRVYLEAFAITYLAALPLFSFGAVLESLGGWTLSPIAFLILEPIRAGVLTWRSRRLA